MKDAITKAIGRYRYLAGSDAFDRDVADEAEAELAALRADKAALLEALEEAEAYFSQWAEDDRLRRIRAAIAKAKGE